MLCRTIIAGVLRFCDEPISAGGKCPVDGRHGGRRSRRPHHTAIGGFHRPVAIHRSIARDAAGAVSTTLPLAVLDRAGDGEFWIDIHLQGVGPAAAQVAVIEGNRYPLLHVGQKSVEPFYYDLLRALPGQDRSKIGHRPVKGSTTIGCDAVSTDVAPAHIGRAVDRCIFGQDGHPDEGGLQTGVEAGAVLHRQFDDAFRAGAPFYGDVIVVGPAAIDDRPVAAGRPGISTATGLGGVGAQRVLADGAHAIDDRAFPRLYHNGAGCRT